MHPPAQRRPIALMAALAAAAASLIAAVPAPAADSYSNWNKPYGKKQDCVKLKSSAAAGPPARFASWKIVDDDNNNNVDDDGSSNSYRFPYPFLGDWDPNSRTDTCLDDGGEGYVRLDLTESFQAQGTSASSPPTMYFHKGGEGYKPGTKFPYGHIWLSDLATRPVYGDQADETGGAGPIPRTELDSLGAHPRVNGYGAGRACNTTYPYPGDKFRVGRTGPPADWNYRSGEGSGASYLKYANPGALQFGDGSRNYMHMQWSWVGKWLWNLPREATSSDANAFPTGSGYGAIRTLLPEGETFVRCDIASINTRAWRANSNEPVGRVTAVYGRVSMGGNTFYGWVTHSYQPLISATADPALESSYGARRCVLVPVAPENAGCQQGEPVPPRTPPPPPDSDGDGVADSSDACPSQFAQTSNGCPAPPPPPPANDTLGTGETLYVDQSRTSQDGRYQLIVQGDGNLVLYGPWGPAWATNTGGSNARLVMQHDGNLVLYRGDGAVLWATNRWGSNARLVVQNDGNLVVYNGSGGVIWSRF